MSVYDDLAQILSARYGKDVRQSIHDAIQQCYSDATGNPESVAAFADDILNINNTISSLQDTITAMQATINGQFNKFFPIGSLYYTGDDTFNPNTAEGWQGTWAKIKGRFILGSSDDYEVNSVGGEATHTLTVEEIPPHTHELYGALTGETKPIANTGNDWAQTTTDFGVDTYIKNTGGGQAFDIMPPYEVKHIWERIA